MSEPELPSEVRDRLALVLDVDDLVAANRLAKSLRPWFGVAKVGLELYTAVGPDAIGAMTDLGYKVFVDLKVHDIPNQAERAARVLGSLGASYVTMHAHGGVPMLQAGVNGLREGAAGAGLPEPAALAVTVLTSDRDAPDHIVPKRIKTAIEGGCHGIVCSVGDLKDVHEFAPRMLRVTPGIRAAGADNHDQGRVGTPGEALDGGSDLLVIGRAVTSSDDPAAAAAELLGDLG
ncbi:MAG: orotidine-5'-phosphate decarboxylase [Actinomycetota bacterium]